MLLKMLMAAMPAKNTTIDKGCALSNLLTVLNKYPTNRLNNAHTTFVVEEESPTPLGWEKGVGNLLPEMPCTKWGTTFANNTPEKKAAIY